MAFTQSPLTKEYLGVKWKLVYYHNSSFGYWKEDRSDVFYCNEAGKYSMFGSLHNRYRIDGRFEFLLEYSNGFNRWQQRNNPIKEKKTVGAFTEGYAELNCTFHDNSWGGLHRSFDGWNSYVDGSTTSHQYFYALFTKTTWNEDIPGPAQAVSLVKLWVRLAFEPCKTLKKNRMMISMLTFIYLIVINK